jgi:hypothetical protein
VTQSATALRLVSPAYSHVPVYAETYGPIVADANAAAGFPPDPEQELGLDALFAISPDGKSVAYDFCVICSRQNLKTGLFKQAAIGWLFVTEQRLVVWSAHEMSTTREGFRDLVGLIEGYEPFSKRLAPGPSNGIMRGNGNEAIELRSGQRCIFKARTNGGGRGLTGDKVILDEGFALKPSHMGSLLPTLSAVPDPQIVVGSSAGLVDSAVLRGIRDRGRAGSSPRQAYLEWGSPEASCADPECKHIWPIAVGCALDNRDFWAMSNPALGRRITEETIQAEREVLPPEEFARERLGWWDDPTSAGPFPAGIWQARACPEIDLSTGLTVSQIAGPVHVALDVAWDRRGCGLAVSGKRVDGKLQLELVEDDTPITMVNLVSRAAEVVRNHNAPGVCLEPASAAGSLMPALRDAGVKVIEVKGQAVNQACGLVYDGILDGSIVHLGQAPLDVAVGGTQKRSSGDSWRWDRRQGADISPFMAVTLAAWAAAGKKPGGSGRVVVLD